MSDEKKISAKSEDIAATEPGPLKEGYDYYLNEAGLLVFTEGYLLRRGYCCKNGCKHCPYGYLRHPQVLR